MQTEGLKGEFDRTQATQALETTLDKLLDRLEEKDEQEPEQQTTESQRAGGSHRNSRNLGPKQPGNQTTIAAHTTSTTAIPMLHQQVPVRLCYLLNHMCSHTYEKATQP